MVGFFDALVEAKQHGAETAVVRTHFVLYEVVAVVEAAGFVVVVVKPFVLEADFPGHGAAEARQFPGIQRRIKGYGKGSELLHWSWVRLVRGFDTGCTAAQRSCATEPSKLTKSRRLTK